MNSLTIIGNLTADPEVRTANTQAGQKTVCSFNVAVNRVVKGSKTADYFKVTCWEKAAENAGKYLAKGRKVAVTGAVTAQGYMGNDGKPKASMEINSPEEIEYLSSRGSDGPGQAKSGRQDDMIPVETDELPF